MEKSRPTSRTKSISNLLVNSGLTLDRVIFSNNRSCVLSVINEQNQLSVLKVRPSDNVHLRNEARSLDQLSHPNIVKMRGFLENDEYCALHLESVNGQALVDYIKEKGPLPENEVRTISRQLLSTLMYLNERKLVYLDLKPDNLIYDPKSKKLTLIDFEILLTWSRRKNFSEPVGTPEYGSPEVNKGSFQGPEAQMWSLGLTLYILLTGGFPQFQEIQKQSSEKKKIFRVFGIEKPGPQFNFIPHPMLSSECNSILKSMLTADASKRATLKTVWKHPWMELEDDSFITAASSPL